MVSIVSLTFILLTVLFFISYKRLSRYISQISFISLLLFKLSFIDSKVLEFIYGKLLIIIFIILSFIFIFAKTAVIAPFVISFKLILTISNIIDNPNIIFNIFLKKVLILPLSI